MAENIKMCSGDCMQCSMQQRVYCSAQMTRMTIDTLNAIQESLKQIKELLQKIDNNDDNTLFNPMQQSEEENQEEVTQAQ
jgi:DNA-binding transcriptional MerR regulator